MTFDEIKTTHLPEIESHLKKYLDSFGSENISAQMSKYHLETGGKRLRALIPLLIFDAFGKNAKKAIPLGCAVEIVHNATLVHDDLQDGDEYRRNRPTVWKKFGVAHSINCGDAFFQYAFDLLIDFDISAENKIKLIKRMVRSTLNVIEGQSQEFLMKDENFPSTNRYFEIVTGKTSGLFTLPVVGAMESLGQNRDHCEEVEQITGKLGVLFQIQDDVLDIYGSKGRNEKATDIAEGKISFLVAHVNEVASLEDKITLQKILRKPRSETAVSDIEAAIQLLDKYRAKDVAVSVIREIQSKLKNRDTLKKSPEIKDVLIHLSEIFLEPIHGIL